MKNLILIGLLLGLNYSLRSQTCCSGGVPLSSNLGLPASEAKTLQFALTYDLNVLETLKTGRQTLEDNSRSRKTHSGILEVGYGFTDKFSIDGFKSPSWWGHYFVRIISDSWQDERENTSGYIRYFTFAFLDSRKFQNVKLTRAQNSFSSSSIDRSPTE